MNNWMIKGAALLTMDRKNPWLDKGDLVVSKGEIIAVGENLAPEAFGIEEVVDGKDTLVTPGIVNAHLHSNDRFNKGRFDNLPLEIWSPMHNTASINQEWTPRECYLRTMLNCIEMLKSGTTTVMDDVIHGFPLSEENIEAVYQAYHDAGMRAQVTIALTDRPFFENIPNLEARLPSDLLRGFREAVSPNADEILELWQRFAERWRDRVRFVISPLVPQRCSNDLLERASELSEALDLPMVMHVLETRLQSISSREMYGGTIIEHLESLGLLTARLALVHAIWVTDEDIKRIARNGSTVIHNPISNLKLGSGIAPIRKFLEAGVVVGLGTDDNSTNDTVNMFEVMKLAAMLHKLDEFDVEMWVGAEDVMRMATLGGARCCLLDDQIGSLTVGKRADLLFFDLNSLSFFPANIRVNQLIYAEHGESIKAVYVEGKPVVENGEMVAIDEREILTEIKEDDGLQRKIKNAIARSEHIEPIVRQVYSETVAGLTA